MLVARRSFLLICLLLAPLLGLVLSRASSQAQASTTSSPSIVPVANIPRPRGVTIDAAGNLFAMDRSAGTVYKITPAGQVSTLADLPDSTDGYVGPIFDSASGNLFISKYGLGTGNQVFRVTLAGVVSVFVTGIAAPASLAADGQGNLFVSSFACPGSVYKVTSTGIASSFGTGLCSPDGIAIGSNGDLFIGDRGTHRIMRVSAAGGAASEFATGVGNPIGVAFNQTGTLFVADYGTGAIYSVDANGVVSPFASGLRSPNGLAFDQQNQLYVSNVGTNQIVTLASPGPNIVSIAAILRARGITIDTAGNLYTLDRDAGTVYKITPAGQVSTIVDLPDGDEGYVGPIFDPVSGNLFVSRYMRRTGTEILQITSAGVVSVFASQVVNPSGMALDGLGNLFVSSDSNPGIVSKITPNGSVSVFATGLNRPDGLAFGPDGALFIGDRGTNRVMRVPAGGGQATAFVTGLQNPMAIAFDRTGRLFVTNSDVGAIVTVDIAGNLSPFVNGLNLPVGMAFDQDNRLFIADYLAGQILRVDDGTTSPTPTATPSPTMTPTATPSPTPTTSPPPIAHGLTINGGALSTTSVSVRLDVAATNADGSQDGLSMSFSNDGETWSDWENYDFWAIWELTDGDGEKTVFARVKDSAGTISAIVSDTIKLDTSVQTEYSVTINNGAIYTNKVAVQLKISAKPGTAEMQVSNDGGFSGVEWEPYSARKNWQITRYRNQEVTRLVYVRFRDVDGNVSGLYLDDIILDMNAPHGHVSIGGQGTLLELAATDDLSGIADMRLSNSLDFDNASWEPFSSSRAWDFDTSIAVYVQFRDAAGNESPTYIASLAGNSTVFLPFLMQ
jgi:sugar lactone lactonase YvrE